MNIQNLIDQGVNVTLSSADLKEFAIYIIESTLAAKVQEHKHESYLSRTECARRLGVSLSTLWRWEKNNYLVPSKVGRKLLYRQSDIVALNNGERREP